MACFILDVNVDAACLENSKRTKNCKASALLNHSQRQTGKVLVPCLYLTTWTPQLCANLEKSADIFGVFEMKDSETQVRCHNRLKKIEVSSASSISFQWALEPKSPSP